MMIGNKDERNVGGRPGAVRTIVSRLSRTSGTRRRTLVMHVKGALATLLAVLLVSLIRWMSPALLILILVAWVATLHWALIPVLMEADDTRASSEPDPDGDAL